MNQELADLHSDSATNIEEPWWGRGYFCATVGAVDEQTVREYIEGQKWDEDVDEFRVVAPESP